jgi:peptide/nickel transport system permease protein
MAGSADHPLGVEWGRVRTSCRSSVGPSDLARRGHDGDANTVTIGTVVGIVAGYVGGWTDLVFGRLMDLILAFRSC